MNNDIQIVPLSRNSRDVLRFLRVSYGIYRDDPHWVAPLLMDLKKVFTDANPLFEHAVMQLWVATRGGRDVGRIAGIIDRNYNRVSKDSAAFFGFFETVEDAAVSRRLFEAVAGWARQAGLKRLLGPMNPTTNDECGLLVEGFDSPPVFMMTYNPRYYVPLVEAAGFRKAKDLLAFYMDLAKIPMDRLGRIAGKIKARNPELVFRAVRRKTLQQDLVKVKEVYNAAWEDNWGFVPMTDAEMDFMAARLKPLLMEGLVWLAEAGSEPVGFLLALPDYNVALQPLRGRLLTPKLLGFIPYLLGWKCPPRTRVITLGMKENYRSKGLESALLIEGLKVGIAAGVTESEASWILEDNVQMRRVLEAIGGRVYKTYRLYERTA
ncbi:MAG TPA: N-acetyltransferase [Verrucomicrobiota bacterium]|nr:N-acetyltransferase [Verrucomicrobiota bacterium]HQL79431.1 N-acetyltransferase [Verrucomicrobiota bacterium]